jgi:hypothetical protein
LSWFEAFLNWVLGFSQFLAGIVAGTVVTGYLTWKVVVPRAVKAFMENRDVKNLIGLLKVLSGHAEEVEKLLQQILEEKRANRLSF